MPVGENGNGKEAACAAACLARLHLPQPDGVLLADSSPENQAWARAHYPGRPLHLVDAASLHAAVLARHGDALKQEAVEGLARRLPELSARRVFSRGQAGVLGLLAVALLAALGLRPEATLRLAVLLMSAALVASGLFRALLAWLGGGKPDAALPLPRRGLPRYTVLVPLYREAAVVAGLARALAALDYPGMLAQVPQSREILG
ncbi:MAG TPA: hypothetical protein VG798_03650 [Rhizomicrobium sp.]|nr:hypothetical protein [Rhizomicrobium sp.]